jgi:hypothetical protein
MKRLLALSWLALAERGWRLHIIVAACSRVNREGRRECGQLRGLPQQQQVWQL